MDEELSMPDWNPLVVYIDCYNSGVIQHNPVAWLKKSIRAFSDWFIARREIKSILLVPFNINLVTPQKDSGLQFSANTYAKPAQAVLNTLLFVMESDPLYGNGNHWLTDKVKIANLLYLNGINYGVNWEKMLYNVLPPDVILTGHSNLRYGRAVKNPLMASNKKCQEAIIFTKGGEITTVRDMFSDSISEAEK